MGSIVEANTIDQLISSLTFDRTVSRQSVHRQALSETFLTGSLRLDATRFVSAAQLPRTHAYYSDHIGTVAIDPLLLLECCRQAETHAVHAHFNAPYDTRFVLCSCSLSLRDRITVRSGIAPAEVILRVDTSSPQWIGESLRALQYVMAIHVSGEEVGEARIHAKYVPGTVYEKMRTRDRVRPRDSSNAYHHPPDGDTLVPARVGRSQPENVVLRCPQVECYEVRARLRLDGHHPSLFDHPQDHIPGMVLMEAGRQMSLLAFHELIGIPPTLCNIVKFEASFHTYAELDEPLTIIGRQTTSPSDTAGCIRVTFEQSRKTIAEAVFTALSV